MNYNYDSQYTTMIPPVAPILNKGPNQQINHNQISKNINDRIEHFHGPIIASNDDGDYKNQINQINQINQDENLFPQTYQEILLNNKIPAERKEDHVLDHNRCYTCKPRGKVKKHIIGKSFCGNFVFHHDMNHRPIIILTPIEHISKIDDMTPELLKKMFEAIYVFCGFWKLKDYQVSYNAGQWKINDHFHIKIRIPEKIIKIMRADHFKRIQLEDNYQ
jgi:hypothetical protein